MVHAFAQILVAKLRDGHFSSDTRALGGDIFAQFGLGENLVRLLPRLLNGDLSIGADGDFTRRRVPSANCIDLMSQMPSRSVDFILTDPPYITRYLDRSGRSVMNDDNTEWLRPAFGQAYRVLKRDSFCVSFYGWSKADLFLTAWRDAGFRVAGHLVFRKNYASSAKFLRYEHEQAYAPATAAAWPEAGQLADAACTRLPTPAQNRVCKVHHFWYIWCIQWRGESMPVDKEKTVRTSVIVPADLYQRVQQLAASNDVSAAWVVRHALQQFLAGYDGEQAIPLKLGPRGDRSVRGRGRKRA
jgi:hypothetical protein